MLASGQRINAALKLRRKRIGPRTYIHKRLILHRLSDLAILLRVLSLSLLLFRQMQRNITFPRATTCSLADSTMTNLFHITHLRNLTNILQSRGLWCDRLRLKNAPDAICIAHQHIKDRRSRRRVQRQDGSNVGAGGLLCDYVPFYFAPRSPMLYTIHRGNVEGYTEGQRPILHLVTSVEAAVGCGRAFAFTDGHADMAFSEFYDELEALETSVDWDIMRSTYWNDTDQHPDRKRRRQAEFLIHEFFPWEAIICVGVKDGDIKRDVEAILLYDGCKYKVLFIRYWF